MQFYYNNNSNKAFESQLGQARVETQHEPATKKGEKKEENNIGIHNSDIEWNLDLVHGK